MTCGSTTAWPGTRSDIAPTGVPIPGLVGRTTEDECRGTRQVEATLSLSPPTVRRVRRRRVASDEAGVTGGTSALGEVPTRHRVAASEPVASTHNVTSPAARIGSNRIFVSRLSRRSADPPHPERASSTASTKARAFASTVANSPRAMASSSTMALPTPTATAPASKKSRTLSSVTPPVGTAGT